MSSSAAICRDEWAGSRASPPKRFAIFVRRDPRAEGRSVSIFAQETSYVRAVARIRLPTGSQNRTQAGCSAREDQ